MVTKEVEEGFNPEHVQQCPNLYARQLRDHLGRELAQVKYVTASPLFELDGREVVRDLTGSNILIGECPWRNLLPHLKLALGRKGLLFFFRIVTDEELKNVWVGNRSYKSMSPEARELMPTFNSLGDLLGADIDLVIIKLGYIGHRNRAAPGLLKEALLIRESLRKPTWLVLDPNRDWTHSHNQDVAEFVAQNFKMVRVPPADPGIEDPTDLVTVDEGDEEDAETADILAAVEEGGFDPDDEETPDTTGIDMGPMS